MNVEKTESVKRFLLTSFEKAGSLSQKKVDKIIENKPSVLDEIAAGMSFIPASCVMPSPHIAFNRRSRELAFDVLALIKDPPDTVFDSKLLPSTFWEKIYDVVHDGNELEKALKSDPDVLKAKEELAEKLATKGAQIKYINTNEHDGISIYIESLEAT